jgi:MFS family permease
MPSISISTLARLTLH